MLYSGSTYAYRKIPMQKPRIVFKKTICKTKFVNKIIDDLSFGSNEQLQIIETNQIWSKVTVHTKVMTSCHALPSKRSIYATAHQLVN